MNRISPFLFAATFFIALSAQSEDTAPMAEVASPTVHGFYLQGTVGEVLGTTGVGLGGKYWSEYIGGAFGFSFDSGKADAEGTDIIDENNFSIGGSLLAGFPKGRLKPFVSVGFGYSQADDDIADIKVTAFEIVPAIGLDIAVTDHLLVGFSALNFSILVSGEVESAGVTADIDGTTFGLFQSFHVGYRF